MSEQIQETISISNSVLSIDIINELNELNQQYLSAPVDHVIADASHNPIRLPFPPTIEPKDLIVNKKYPLPNGKQSRAPNAFIIYRKAFVKAAREQGYILPMTAISSMASAAWEQENIMVKEEYKRIAKDAHKLVKEMFPKKSNQRKRKEKWNLVSFHDKSSNNTNKTNSNSSENISSENISAQESTATVAPALTSSSSSPNLSEFDGNISEEGFVLQQQQQQPVIDEVQISNDYLIDNLPYYYLDPNLYIQKEDYQSENNFLLTNWLNQSDIYTFETFETLKELDLDLLDTPMDSLKNNSQSSLNMTLPMMDSGSYNLNF